MVEAKTVIALVAIALFFIAGGGALIRPALATAQKDFGEIKTGATQQVQSIKSTLQRNGAGV